MSLLATRNAVGLLISTLGLTKTGELTADSLTVKFPNCTPPRSNNVCASQRLSSVCSFAKLYLRVLSRQRDFLPSVYHRFPFYRNTLSYSPQGFPVLAQQISSCH